MIQSCEGVPCVPIDESIATTCVIVDSITNIKESSLVSVNHVFGSKLDSIQVNTQTTPTQQPILVGGNDVDQRRTYKTPYDQQQYTSTARQSDTYPRSVIYNIAEDDRNNSQEQTKTNQQDNLRREEEDRQYHENLLRERAKESREHETFQEKLQKAQLAHQLELERMRLDAEYERSERARLEQQR